MRLLQDLRFAMRSLRKSPAYAIVMLCTMALGVGLNSAMFSIVNAVMLRPLPYQDPDRLVGIWEAQRGGSRSIHFAGPNYEDLQDRAGLFEAVAQYRGGQAVVGGGASPVRAQAYLVSREFFRVMGATAEIGRLFSPEETTEGAAPAAILGHGLWQSSFGGSEAVLGKTVTVFGRQAQIVGVMPAGFEYPKGAAVYLPAELVPLGRSRTAHNSTVIGRLKQGVDLKAAQAEASALAASIAEAHPEVTQAFDIQVNGLHDQLVGDRRSTLILLLSIVGVVLLIACANMASLLLSQAGKRVKEVAIRRALGAGAGRLARQLLTESVVLGFMGAAAGLLLCAFSLSLLNAIVPAGYLHSGPIVLDWRVAFFTIALGILCGIVFGLAPAWLTTRAEPNQALRGDGSAPVAGSGRRRRLGGLVIVPQYAFSLAALIVAGLIVKSLLQLGSVQPGFETAGIVTARISLPSNSPSPYAEPAAVASYYRVLLERVRSHPGVLNASVDLAPPLTDDYRINGGAISEGMSSTAENADWRRFNPDWRVVGPDYFGTLQIPLLQGREFEERDNEGALPVAIVNQSLARRMWGEESPIGKKLMLSSLDRSRERSERWLTVVGLVPDIHERALDRPGRSAVYAPYPQHLERATGLDLVVSVRGRADDFVAPIRRYVRERDANVPPGEVRTLDAWALDTMSQPRFRAGLLSGFGVLAVLLAVLGVYGVMSHAVTLRRGEIAVRMALGARKSDILKLLASEGFRFVIVGQIVGTVAALLFSDLVEGMLFQVSATDASVFWIVSPLLAVAVLATCLIPARRAGRVQPMEVIRS